MIFRGRILEFKKENLTLINNAVFESIFLVLGTVCHVHFENHLRIYSIIEKDWIMHLLLEEGKFMMSC